MHTLVNYALNDGVASITLDDGKANALGLLMLGELGSALNRAQAEKAAVVVLSGRPGMFSGGFDLAAFKRGPEELVQMLQAGAALGERLLSLPLPVLAVCSGHAIAMGAFLLLSCDQRIGVDQGARIQVNEVQNGMTLPRFAIELCRQRLSPAHFNLATLTSKVYAPADAVVAGFLDEVVAPDALGATAQSRALALKGLNAEAFAASKLRVHGAALVALRSAIVEDSAEWAQRFAAGA